jgi:hypothetical protein
MACPEIVHRPIPQAFTLKAKGLQQGAEEIETTLIFRTDGRAAD